MIRDNLANDNGHDENDDTDNVENIVHERSNINFNVIGDFSICWFSNYINSWEQNTFYILNYYAPRYVRQTMVSVDDVKRNTYIDIGDWIGPTVMYAANFYTSVVALEPDPVALERLHANLSVNKYRNITVIESALTNVNDKILFGGNGSLGNSESTILVSNSNYIDECWGGRWTREERGENIIEVDGITIDRLIKDYNIDPTSIGLIKMDIEGGEFILIPDLINFLFEYDIPLYISLHYVFLKDHHISFLLQILFDSYTDCFIFDNIGRKEKVSREKVLEEKLTMLVFENVKKSNVRNQNRDCIIQEPRPCHCEII